jgi:hypothetical protein
MVFDAMARHKGGVLSMAIFKETIGKENPPPSPERCVSNVSIECLKLDGRFPTLKEAEDCLIAEAVRRASGNQGAAAVLLGISRQALNKRLIRK